MVGNINGWRILLYHSAPTSGGKTLVAELLLLRALLQHNGTMVLLVVPFIALATEKRDYLRDVWAPLQVRFVAFLLVEGYYQGIYSSNALAWFIKTEEPCFLRGGTI